MERLARKDPETFLENCLRRYRGEVKGYRLTMRKQEREDGDLKPEEVVEAWYREEPHSVLLRWREGAGRADRVLFVGGQNGGKLLARPRGRLARAFAGDVVARGMDGPDGRQLSRFGLKRNVERTLSIWKEARAHAPVMVTYLGVKKVKEAGDRPCYALRFTSPQPMYRGATQISVYVDRETWLEVGLVFTAAGDKLMAGYFFSDIELNPKFDPDQFTRAALRR